MEKSKSRTWFRCSCIALIWASCASQPSAPPVLTDIGSVAAHEGELVTLRGNLHCVKYTMLLGVSVAKSRRDKHGSLVEATGILRRCYEPMPDNVWDSMSIRYGEYFVLEDPKEPNRLARVGLVEPGPTQQSSSDKSNQGK